MSKYKNVKTTLDGITFDSKKEATRYTELMMLQRSGLIQNLRLQVPFELIPAQKEGKITIERALGYVADFVYTENGKTIVEDCKGMKTRGYIIKRKLMLWVHGLRIKEV